MYQRKPRRFRRRSNGRNHMLHGSNNSQVRLRPSSFSNGQVRNKFGTSLSAEKLFEKYSSLAKEAMSSGDKTLSENYLQHADHFMRIIEDKNRNRNQNKDGVNYKPAVADRNLSDTTEVKTTEEKKDIESKNKD